MPFARRLLWCIPISTVGWLLSFSFAQADTLLIKDLLLQAQFHEQQGEWHQAVTVYDAILRQDRNLPGVRERYHNSVRRYWQVRRHTDPSFQKEVLSLEYGQALHLYGLVRDSLLDSALGKKKVDSAKLFRKGIEELEHALSDPIFTQQYLPNAKPHEIRAFRSFLKKSAVAVEHLSRPQAIKHVREVAMAAQNMLQLSSAVVILEFTCGACYALDEYTLYLTPNQLKELCDSLRGEFAGVGLTLRLEDGKILIDEVAAYSPAAEQRLARDDQVLAIDRKSTMTLSPETAQELLGGPVGTSVNLDIYSPGMGMRSVSLQRRVTFLPSITYQMKPEGVGYIHIACFQDTTVQELDDALATLGKSGLKALVIDLRGNSGGLFEAAVDVARRFIALGIIASTENTDPKFNMVYHARGSQVVTAPLVVLIDGDTASAAEVLAGALKGHQRARLVGQTTFGKGCTQCIVKLPAAPGGIPTGGIRLTVARFFGPDGQPYTGRGVVPDVAVDRVAMASMSTDRQLDEAFNEAHRLLEIR
ncbi:MAG: S41 family peptidase [Gemmataceae bacterium]|nr:S41 family peptidase [Gemmataceae bacterium]